MLNNQILPLSDFVSSQSVVLLTVRVCDHPGRYSLWVFDSDSNSPPPRVHKKDLSSERSIWISSPHPTRSGDGNEGIPSDTFLIPRQSVICMKKRWIFFERSVVSNTDESRQETMSVTFTSFPSPSTLPNSHLRLKISSAAS